MADIMGHGLGSALTMAEVRASARAYAATTLDITSVLASVHYSLKNIVDDNRFVTMFLGRTGPPLGMFPDQQFDLGSPIELAQGDTLLLLTDGVTEAIDVRGSIFGIERALDFIRSQQQSTAGDQVHGLYSAVRAVAGGVPQMDDITYIACKVL
jgi:serine phosphatase RsbU (regulator of sigma subunit)